MTRFDTKLCGVALKPEPRGLELEPNPSFMPAPHKTVYTCLAAPSPFDVRTSQRALVEIRHWSRVKDDEEFELLGGEKFDARSSSRSTVTRTRTPHHTRHYGIPWTTIFIAHLHTAGSHCMADIYPSG